MVPGRVRGPLHAIPILTFDHCAVDAEAYRQRPAPTRPAWDVHQRGPEMTKQQARRGTAARSARLAIVRFVVAARLGNGIDGRRVRRG
jgi:hypothetical protein